MKDVAVLGIPIKYTKAFLLNWILSFAKILSRILSSRKLPPTYFTGEQMKAQRGRVS